MKINRNLLLSAVVLSGLFFLASCGSEDDDATPQNPLSIEDFETTIEENPSAGQSLGNVQASSTSTERFTLSLSSESPAGALAISNSGELTVNDAELFNFEVNPTISAVVTMESGEFSRTANVVVQLTDVFEGTIWSGPTLSFAKGDGTDPTDAANQDRLTSNVHITRGNDGGQIYNAVTESTASQNSSPEGTEWALGNTSQIGDLVFQHFRAAVGAPKDVVGKALVLHLIEDDIYLDLEFTSWSQGKNGGFAYNRSTPNQ